MIVVVGGGPPEKAGFPAAVCWASEVGVGHISVRGSPLFWEEVRGARGQPLPGVTSSWWTATPCREGHRTEYAHPAAMSCHGPASCYRRMGSGGGKARQFVVMLHFLFQNFVFTTIGLACPGSSGLRSELCCFISVSSGSFLFAPAGRLLFHVFPPLLHAVPARQFATCSKAGFPLLSPVPQ